MFKIPDWDDYTSKIALQPTETLIPKRKFVETQDINLDEILLSVKKKKLDEQFENENQETLLFTEKRENCDDSSKKKVIPETASLNDRCVINTSKTVVRENEKCHSNNKKLRKTQNNQHHKGLRRNEKESTKKHINNAKTSCVDRIRVLDKITLDNDMPLSKLSHTNISQTKNPRDLESAEKNKSTKLTSIKANIKKKPLETSKATKFVVNGNEKPKRHYEKLKRNLTPRNSNEESTTNIERDGNIALNNNIESINRLKEEPSPIPEEKKEISRRYPMVSGSNLREKMLEKLKAAQFRMLNEKLYTSTGAKSQQMFEADPAAFQLYHRGFQQQLKKWQFNPLDVIVKEIMKMPRSRVIADMGCGEAALARRVPHAVHSFDLVAAPGVRACDMAHTPLPAASVDVAVYCLALMGTELTDYLLEANRILKIGGQLLIAEVESRFPDADAFARAVERLGFRLARRDASRRMFHFLYFSKTRAARGALPALRLRPCVYARRGPAAAGGASGQGKRGIKRK